MYDDGVLVTQRPHITGEQALRAIDFEHTSIYDGDCKATGGSFPAKLKDVVRLSRRTA